MNQFARVENRNPEFEVRKSLDDPMNRWADEPMHQLPIINRQSPMALRRRLNLLDPAGGFDKNKLAGL
jgi:hypothetical protein